MTETEARQFLVKYLGKSGFDVERNESGAVNEGYPDLTISRDKIDVKVELKQGYISKTVLTVAKFRPRQKGKLALLSTTQTIRVLVVCPDKSAYLVSTPMPKIRLDSSAIKWHGTLDRNCDLATHLNIWWRTL